MIDHATEREFIGSSMPWQEVAVDSVLAVAVIGCFVLAACTPVQTRPDSFCQWAHPILLDKKDVLTPDTKAQIVAYDETGKKLCGWKPPH